MVVLLPWHPLSWAVRSQLTRLQEIACDDWVLHSTGDDVTYAESLLKLVPSGKSRFALAAVYGKHSLRRRLRHILSGRRVSPHVGVGWLFSASIAVSLGVAVVSFAQRPPSPEMSLERPVNGESVSSRESDKASLAAVRHARDVFLRLGVSKYLEADRLGIDSLAVDYVREGAASNEQQSAAAKDTLRALRELSLTEPVSTERAELIAARAAESVVAPAELGQVYAEVAGIHCQHGDPLRTVAWAQAALRLPLSGFQRLRMYEYWSASSKRVNERSPSDEGALSVLAPAIMGTIESSKYGIRVQGIPTVSFEDGGKDDRATSIWLADRLTLLSKIRDALVSSVANEYVGRTEAVDLALRQLTVSPGLDESAWRQIRPPVWLNQGRAFACTVPLRMSTIRPDIARVMDAVADTPGLADDLLSSLEQDPDGPQVNLDQEIFAHFGTSMTVVIDYREANHLRGERILVGIELSAPRRVEATWNRLMRRDAHIRGSQVGNTTVWTNKSDDSRGIPFRASSVAFDHLFLSTDPLLLVETILRPAKREDDLQQRRAVIECRASTSGGPILSMFSLSLAAPVNNPKQADFSFYFDSDDCAGGAIVGHHDTKGWIYPIGKHTWQELRQSSNTPGDGVSIEAIRPITKAQEGFAFWTKTVSGRYAIVRIAKVESATYDDITRGKTASVEFEWIWR